MLVLVLGHQLLQASWQLLLQLSTSATGRGRSLVGYVLRQRLLVDTRDLLRLSLTTVSLLFFNCSRHMFSITHTALQSVDQSQREENDQSLDAVVFDSSKISYA